MTAFTLPLPLPLAPAIQMTGTYGHRHMMGWWGWGYGILGMLFWLALIVLAVVLVWWLLGQGRRDRPSATPRGETALEILEKRYARGEIDREEFERMKTDLGH